MRYRLVLLGALLGFWLTFSVFLAAVVPTFNYDRPMLWTFFMAIMMTFMTFIVIEVTIMYARNASDMLSHKLMEPRNQKDTRSAQRPPI